VAIKVEVRFASASISFRLILWLKLAIDVWAAGMILLFFLVRKFPLFQSSDDIEALMELAAILGRKKMEKAATLHSASLSHQSDIGLLKMTFIHRPDIYDKRSFRYTGWNFMAGIC
jgi:hypothetical protein